ETVENLRAARSFQVSVQRIDHHVPDKADLFWRYSLSKQVFVCVSRRGEQQIRKRIRHNAIDLLRHRSVAAPKTSLDVSYSHQQLGGDDRRGHRGVDIAYNDNPVSRMLQ